VAALIGIALMPMTSMIAAARLIRAGPPLRHHPQPEPPQHRTGETQDETDADPAGVDGVRRAQRPGPDGTDDQQGPQ
jgi:hypothetical protein